jgi:osmotically inducible protein OsmC
MKRRAFAIWKGTRKDGEGSLTSTSKVLKNTPYSVYSRFKKEDSATATNPEELIAAAHAGCYSMALGFLLSDEGFHPKEIKTEAMLSVGIVADLFQINSIHLDVIGNVPEISAEKFTEVAEKAKKVCPVSEALKSIEITLTAKLDEAILSKKSESLT